MLAAIVQYFYDNERRFWVLTDLESEFAKNFEDFANNCTRLTLTDSGNRISPRELQRPEFPLGNTKAKETPETSKCVGRKDITALFMAVKNIKPQGHHFYGL